MQYSRSFARLFAQLSSRRHGRRGQRGMTLLEIMIVMAILALVMGLLVGPKVMSYFKQAKIDNTNMKLRLMAYQAYTGWAAAHPSTECPASLTELAPFMNNEDLNDSWGVPLIMACGRNAPPAARGFGVSSAGEDHQVGTPDDLHSWTQAATPTS
jgi:general secretion pathway protein G